MTSLLRLLDSPVDVKADPPGTKADTRVVRTAGRITNSNMALLEIVVRLMVMFSLGRKDTLTRRRSGSRHVEKTPLLHRAPIYQ